MSKDKIYPKGVSFFSPKQGAPTWVKGNIVIQPNDLFQFLNYFKQKYIIYFLENTNKVK